MNTVSVALNLPTSGLPHDYAAALMQAQTEMFNRGDQTGAYAVQQLLNLVHAGIAHTTGPLRVGQS